MTVQKLLDALEGLDWNLDVVLAVEMKKRDGRIVIVPTVDISRVVRSSDERGEYVAVLT